MLHHFGKYATIELFLTLLGMKIKVRGRGGMPEQYDRLIGRSRLV